MYTDSQCIEDEENEFEQFYKNKSNFSTFNYRKIENNESKTIEDKSWINIEEEDKIHMPRKTISKQESHANIKNIQHPKATIS